MGFSGSAPEKKLEAVASGSAIPAAQSSDDIVAVIAAAVIAYCGGGQIACIRRLSGNRGWSNLAHIEAVSVRNQMF